MASNFADDRRFVLPDDVQIRLRARDQAEVRRRRRAALLSPDLLQLLMQFAEPRRVAEIQRSVDVTDAALIRFVARLCDAGILIEAEREDAVDLDLRSLLRPEVLRGTRSATELREHLEAGRLVIIPNAFREDFAEAVYAGLDGCTQWDAYEWFPTPSATEALPAGIGAFFISDTTISTTSRPIRRHSASASGCSPAPAPASS